MFTKKGRKPDEGTFNTAEVEVTGHSGDLSAPDPALRNVVSSESLKPLVVPATEPEAVSPEMSKVNLRESVTINGRTVGPGVGCLVPTDAFDVWRHALAKE